MNSTPFANLPTPQMGASQQWEETVAVISERIPLAESDRRRVAVDVGEEQSLGFVSRRRARYNDTLNFLLHRVGVGDGVQPMKEYNLKHLTRRDASTQGMTRH